MHITCCNSSVTSKTEYRIRNHFYSWHGQQFSFRHQKKSQVGAGVDPTTLAAKTCGLRALNESNVDTAEVTVILFQTYIWPSDPTRQHPQIQMIFCCFQTDKHNEFDSQGLAE